VNPGLWGQGQKPASSLLKPNEKKSDIKASKACASGDQHDYSSNLATKLKLTKRKR
jgi:hypothetical protein